MEEITNELDISTIIADLKGFGIEDTEEILAITSKDKEVRIRLGNIPTEEEMAALVAVEELKGYTWVQRVKIEIISRAITYINGVNIRKLSPTQRMVVDPSDKVERDIQVVLRNLLLNWGQEFVNILWKVLMVHCSKIEEKLFEQFPDSSIMTNYEKRFLEQAEKEINEAYGEVIKSTLDEVVEDENKKEDK